MTHIMLDLETLSTKCNAAILAIGAVMFDPTLKVHKKFYQAVQTTPVVEGFDISADTLDWWTKQSEEAQQVFKDPNAVPINEALTLFAEWVLAGTDKRDIYMWGNGASFDNVILSNAYDLCDLEKPWMYYNDRCYRTAKNLNSTVPITRMGTYHNALDDAETQAVHLLAMEVPLA